jgi:hypothetical protein
METNALLLIMIPILTAIISVSLTYYFTSRSKKNEAILKFKEEKYSNLLILLQGFVGNTTSRETKKKFFEEQYKSWLYCSDEVIKAVNDMVELVINSKGNNPIPEEGRKAVGTIVLKMRKDLLGKTKLSFSDFRYTDVIEK